MREIPKTLGYVAVAALLVLLAVMSTPGEVILDPLEEAGTDFFPGFQDPQEATNLAVIEFDEGRSRAVPFNVLRQDNGLWTIPSHNNYAADAQTRMAQAATMVIGLRKASVRSTTRLDHKSLGVVDPLDPGLDLEGRGTRITFKDTNENVLADLILGNEVENRPDQRYVRLPGSNTTYTAVLTADLSTRFEDWIETDLLKVSSPDITDITFDNHSVDERQGVVIAGETLEVTKVDSEWQMEGLAEDEELDTTKMSTAVTTLTGLKIVGVRAKPQGLTAALERAQGIQRSIIAQELQGKGYFLVGERLYSNEGDLLVKTDTGVVYTLKFGEVVFGTGDALTSGTAQAEPAAATQDPDQGPDPVEGSHRYLMVTAHFDEELLDKPEGTPLPQEHLDQRQVARDQIQKIVDAVNTYKSQNEDALPESLTALLEGDEPLLTELALDPWETDYLYEKTDEGFTVRSFGEDKALGGDGAAADISSDAFDVEDGLRDLAIAFEDFQTQVEEGKEEADSLSQRFGPWYYVIDADSFSKLHLGRADLVKKKDG